VFKNYSPCFSNKIYRGIYLENKEYKLRMYENRLLMKIFGPKKEESNVRLEIIT
jgi:hypothetical protein